ncbi:CGNR zinc finger domain-containing protein [Nonomuraea sp. SMC257]|uniref:CGNR zinc finger domain-containing protein n=1 Tax=Nonomuraea montanisoli TaxID=2741721 RepID=A0A7Y6IEM9_9ACTN|nr:CGNR zinc finger domain-containing protein [Nonomuraea montanisoli]NUW36885.1 CGNR zinc finger domain-containing protein [Nonomuraea montanisoli]
MPAPAELVRDFVNTLDVECGTDELACPAELALWLRERGLAGPLDRATDDDLATALALREGLRAALRRETTPHTVLPVLPLRLVVDPLPRLVPVDTGVRGALAVIAGAVADASWDRLKVCSEITCQWAFIDVSKNRSRSWCSMRVCGNRTKTRAYRARKQGSRRLQASNTDTV